MSCRPCKNYEKCKNRDGDNPYSFMGDPCVIFEDSFIGNFVNVTVKIIRPREEHLSDRERMEYNMTPRSGYMVELTSGEDIWLPEEVIK